MKDELMEMVDHARNDLSDHTRPRDETERAIVNALGDISWDEAVDAINKHRACIADDAGILADNG